MAEVVPDSDEQSLQHFLSNSPWDERTVMDQVAGDVNKWLGHSDESALYIDESAFKKQGKKSVGAARQWNDRLGKVDNSQVGVSAALGRGDRVGIVDARLYLPQEWTDDPKRCRNAKVPEAEIAHKTKLDLALDMVRRAKRLGLSYRWVGMDGFYANPANFFEHWTETERRLSQMCTVINTSISMILSLFYPKRPLHGDVSAHAIKVMLLLFPYQNGLSSNPSPLGCGTLFAIAVKVAFALRSFINGFGLGQERVPSTLLAP